MARPLDLGRQRDDEPLLALEHGLDADRVAIAPMDDRAMPRSFLRIEPRGDDVELRNLHRSVPALLRNGVALAPSAHSVARPPLSIDHGDYTISIEPAEVSEAVLNALPAAPLAPAASAEQVVEQLPESPREPAD
ncbi:MAG TPA: hypothetical protein VG713_12190, partial [Pirellulales bacterium]|nr:hypothetical protein [Pirellulales bacterium]